MDDTSDKKSGDQDSQRQKRKQQRKRRKKWPTKQRWTAEKSDMQYNGGNFHSGEW